MFHVEHVVQPSYGQRRPSARREERSHTADSAQRDAVPSEERALRWQARSPGVAGVAVGLLLQDLERGRTDDELRWRQTQHRSAGGRPACSRCARRFTDDKVSADLEQGSGALGRRSRLAKAASHDRGRRAPQRASAHLLSASVDHLHLVASQLVDGLLQEPAALVHGVDKHEVEVGALHGQDQCGDPATAAEVDDAPGHALQGSDEPLGVVDVVLDGTGSEKAQCPSALELVVQALRHVAGVSQG